MSLPLLVDQGDKSVPWTARPCTSASCKAAQHIVELSRSLMDACNPHCYDLLKSLGEQHVAPTFRAKFESTSLNSWEEFLASQRYWGELHPKWENRIVHATAEVNDNHANGTVYLLTEILRWSRDVKRTAVTVHKWKKSAGKWVCYEAMTMRGLDPMLGGGDQEANPEPPSNQEN
ncbi:hypothetical protein M409DRAFT_30481 [Zasmidium cellare ATCC 36951]|uniref:SnoaL-like domain-containing protein n=1 Tax=Zasmidium cellare ATCC 36951 TaxID=1080233 RepID=A0A6A6BW82_ZASCE|nr:uncharacterized protein M409DRAFT_30481 [Zasmidium cellare ATCC 36951]KAF2159061.1 hypothetical protein M409DRAFT_30481 [Zasmidium cellare ATCC 36951]